MNNILIDFVNEDGDLLAMFYDISVIPRVGRLICAQSKGKPKIVYEVVKRVEYNYSESDTSGVMLHVSVVL